MHIKGVYTWQVGGSGACYVGTQTICSSLIRIGLRATTGSYQASVHRLYVSTSDRQIKIRHFFFKHRRFVSYFDKGIVNGFHIGFIITEHTKRKEIP